MQFGSDKNVDVARLKADLAAAAVELLSAHCAVDRVRLQYSPQDIVSFGERSALKRAISLDPRNGTYHFQLARAYKAEGLHEKAEEELAQMRALSHGGAAGKMEILSRGPAETAAP